MNFNATIIGQIIAFTVFIWFCYKYVWPPILDAMRSREKRIADSLEAADLANKDVELARQKATEKLKDAKQQASTLIEQANKRAAQIVEDAKGQARIEGDRLKERAQAEIEQEVNRAKDALRAQLAKLTIAGAEKVLQASVDGKVHDRLLDQLAAEL